MEWKETWKMTLMNNSDTEFVFKIETLKKIAFPMIKLKTFSSLRQTFTSLMIEGKIPKTVK